MFTTETATRGTSAMGRARAQRASVLAHSGVPALTAVLAIAAGAIHLAHNYLPMPVPAAGGGAPPPDAAGAAGGPGGLMSLVMPHLTEVMLLNCIGFVALAVLLVAIARARTSLRVIVDLLLAGLSLATLYAWDAMGRANPYGTGTLALIVELALVVVALADAAYVALRSKLAPARAVSA